MKASRIQNAKSAAFCCGGGGSLVWFGLGLFGLITVVLFF